MRVNVFDEGSENVIWYKVIFKKKKDTRFTLQRTHLYLLLKERFLGDDEIIENLVVRGLSLYNTLLGSSNI